MVKSRLRFEAGQVGGVKN